MTIDEEYKEYVVTQELAKSKAKAVEELALLRFYADAPAFLIETTKGELEPMTAELAKKLSYGCRLIYGYTNPMVRIAPLSGYDEIYDSGYEDTSFTVPVSSSAYNSMIKEQLETNQTEIEERRKEIELYDNTEYNLYLKLKDKFRRQ
jgi:hypothetical protein